MNEPVYKVHKGARKGLLSRAVRLFREGVKQTSAYLAAKMWGKQAFVLFGIPSGLTSIADPCAKKYVYPATPVTLQAPKTIDEFLCQRFQALLKGALVLPEAGVLTLDKGIATCKGGNLSCKGKLVTDFLQPIDGKPPHQDVLFRFSTQKFFPRIYQSDTPIITLAAGWQGAFYHWMFEVLPRLHLVEQAGHSLDNIYVEANFPFQKQSLELLGITPSHRIDAATYAAVAAPQLIIPSIPEIPTPWGCRFLRDKFLPKLDPQLDPKLDPKLDKGSRQRRRLYVSRSDASRRCIINEAEVFALLARYGFEKVTLSPLAFQEQIELFATAETVVGPHGAGFSHLVFCPPGTPVLEIFSPAYVNLCYWHVSDRVGLPYYYLFGEGGHSPDATDPDITVDLAKLKASLALMRL